MDTFESSVVLDGTKLNGVILYAQDSFESSVVLDGTKLSVSVSAATAWFESSVVLDGTKLPNATVFHPISLRVVLF